MFEYKQFFPFWPPGPLFRPVDGIDVINYSASTCGPPGPMGVQGAQGPQGTSSSVMYNTILIDSDYTVEQEYPYIGVNSANPVIITLPARLLEGTVLVVKLEMGPPIGNRKVTIIAENDIKIDNKSSYVMKTPHEAVTLIYRGSKWHII